jgi:hypothetical protein
LLVGDAGSELAVGVYDSNAACTAETVDVGVGGVLTSANAVPARARTRMMSRATSVLITLSGCRPIANSLARWLNSPIILSD